MKISREEVFRITEEACSLFGMELGGSFSRAAPSTVMFKGRIAIGGASQGDVAMGCSEGFARCLASLMFEVEPCEVADEEIADAFGELVNMTTGHIKAYLPDGARMGLPHVSQGTIAELFGGADGEGLVWHFSHDGEPLTLSITLAA